MSFEEGLSTPVNMKLQLIPVLQHMHHDTTTAAMVRILCTQLLKNYPAARDFTLVILNTLTELSLATLVDIPSQVSLVLDAGYSDIETGIIKLAKRPQCWTNPTIERLVEIIQTLPLRRTPALLHVLVILTRSPGIVHSHHDRKSKLMSLAHDMALSCNLLVAVKSVQIITNIVSYCYKEGLPVSPDSIFVLEALLLVLAVSDTTTPYILKTALKCTVSLCQSNLSLCSQFVDLIGNQMLNESNTQSALLCEALAAIGNLEPQVLKPFQPSILKKLNHGHYNQSKTMLYTLLFQIHAGSNFAQSNFLQYISPLNSIPLWDIYKVARSAARYGHHNICLYILNNISHKICSENLYFWLISFQYLSQGENFLKTGTEGENRNVYIENLEKSITCYCKALSSLKAANVFTNQVIEYVNLRCELLQDVSRLLATCNSLCTTPPPAIASTVAQTTRDDLHRFGHITTQLRKRSLEFHALIESYDRLYELCFDLDNSSLLNIKIFKYMSSLLEYSINMIVCTNNQYMEQPLLDIEDVDSLSLEHKIMIKYCNEILQLTKLNFNAMPKVITHKKINIVKRQCQILMDTPMCFPRFIFQSLQSTQIKLSIQPERKFNTQGTETVTIQNSHELIIKVEGVIEKMSRVPQFRSIKNVRIHLNSQLLMRSVHDASKLPDASAVKALKQEVPAHNDFFTAEFLLSFQIGGSHQIQISASLVDLEDKTWHTGPRHTLTVKVHDEIHHNRPGVSN
uniref:Integrator complex subunit 7 n=1 Tax=Cacopsylla melanoneura TaxID=428564 RepID=A0A8D8XVY1_9HEMI